MSPVVAAAQETEQRLSLDNSKKVDKTFRKLVARAGRSAIGRYFQAAAVGSGGLRRQPSVH